MAQKSILFIDDDLTWGELISYALTRRCGHKVNWFVRARVQDADIILMDPDGKETPLDPSKYDVVLCDGRLKFSALDGWELAPLLVARGLRVIAVSGASTLNDTLIENGAFKAIIKDDLMKGSLDGSLNLD